MTTIVVADDHHIVRRGVRALLEAEPDLSIIGETGDGLEAVKLIERLHPDVLVLDLVMSSLNGLKVTRQVRQRSPATRVVILSMYANEAYVLEALRAGAVAYVLKDSTADDLVRAIHEAIAGHHYLSPPLSECAIEVYLEKAKHSTLDPYDTLTDRERQVLYLAADGRTNAEIAAKLFVSRRTVETHRTHVMRKLGVRSQGEMIRFALQRRNLPTGDC